MAALKAWLLFFSLSLAAGICSSATAASGTDAVVKIYSVYQGGHFQPRVGSGLLFDWSGRQFVLTSDHVVYHSNQGLEHTITDSQGQSLKAEYLVSDAGRGLALLRLKELASTFATYSFPALVPDLKISQALTLVGYPAEATDLLTSEGGVIQDLQAPSDLFAQVPQLLTVAEAHAEFGMSGGAAFSDDGLFRGVLSHQKDDSEQALTLLIPEPVVRHWLAEVLTAEGGLRTPSPITLVQDPAQQVSDFISYRSGYLYMTRVHPTGSTGETGIEILLSKSSVSEGLFSAATLKPVQDFLSLDKKTRVRALYFRKNGFGGRVIRASEKFVLNMRYLMDPNLEPLWTVQGYNIEAPLKEVKKVRQALVTTREALSFAQAPRLQNFVVTVSQQLEPAWGWQQLKPKDLAKILTSTDLQGEWAFILKQPQGQALKNQLQQLQNIFFDLTL